jgi:hypothetical protein
VLAHTGKRAKGGAGQNSAPPFPLSAIEAVGTGTVDGYGERKKEKKV